MHPPIRNPRRAVRGVAVSSREVGVQRSSFVLVVGFSLLVSLPAMSQPLVDDFESYSLGDLPGAPWQDITSRLDSPTVPSPTAFVLDTTGPDGLPTKAVQIVDAIGTSSGIVSEIQPATTHSLRMDVRIDQFSDAQGAWPGGIGLLQDEGAADFNGDPQAVIYAWQDQRWHMFVKNGPAGTQTGIDVVISGVPRITLGSWYSLQLDADTTSGVFNASVFDAASGTLLGSRTLSFPGWNPAFGEFDALAAFDGEGNAAGGTHGGVSTYDNLSYIPAPATMPFAVVAAIAFARRRR